MAFPSLPRRRQTRSVRCRYRFPRSVAVSQKDQRARLVGPCPSVTATSTLQTLLSRLSLDLQLIVYTEGAEKLIGFDSGNLFVHLAVDGAVQRQVAVRNNNANGARRIQRVPAQHGVAVNHAQRLQTQPVVKLRNRLQRKVGDYV